nr:hypothetical protein [uncultured Chryseobacterium sp.]
MIKKPMHSFHIPVMGLAYTIDSPIRAAHYGISSVISIIDDELIEKIKGFYNKKFGFSYPEISIKTEDYRAKRITDYLNLVEDIVSEKFKAFKQELAKNRETLKNFISMLPDTSDIKTGLEKILENGDYFGCQIRYFLEKNLSPGSIDVNIMTKVDKDNFRNDIQLPIKYNDAHASLRGFAESKLRSSVVLSAGMNPKLYSYIEEFEDFFPDQDGHISKKIILKVSDFRSAMIQGNFLAKKGLWVSEYRIESGLNCGGHAFATEGLLLGPIMEEFKRKKPELISVAYSLMIQALVQKGKPVPKQPLPLKITVQGGVGTSEEHQFLLENYCTDSVGWGSPFLLVPEATSMDEETRKLLARSQEEDFYLSSISPLGIPFNTVKGTSSEILKNHKAAQSKFGSSCPKKLLALSKEYSPKGICTASKKYQDLKLKELELQKQDMTDLQFKRKVADITVKACLCVGLVNAAYIENNLPLKGEKQGVVICPGPNLAYFDRQISLSEMIRHIYGRENVLSNRERPNMFINELKMYIEYLIKEIDEFSEDATHARIKKWNMFKNNLLDGIIYYQTVFGHSSFFRNDREKIKLQLDEYRKKILEISFPEVLK